MKTPFTQRSTMKIWKEIGVTIFLSYLVLTIEVQGQEHQKNGENIHQHITDGHVNKTILTKFGEVFDCIDINRQPAFDHPLLKNHVLRMKPTSYPENWQLKSSSAANTTQSQLTRIACPTGTIPILRNSKAGFMPPLFFSPDGSGEIAAIRTQGEIYGAQGLLNIYEPDVKGNGDLSAQLINVLNGQPGDHESVGAGSMVTRVFGDTFARFHIFFWLEDQYKACFDFRCPGFVQINQNIGLGGRITPVSTYDGKQVAIKLFLFQDRRTKDWWLIYDTTTIGYWPSPLFRELNDKAEMVMVGGYVLGPTIISDPPQMGSGHFAAEGEGKAAYARDIKIVDYENKLADLDFDKTIAYSSKQPCYTVDAYDHNSDGTHFFYGGPGGCHA